MDPPPLVVFDTLSKKKCPNLVEILGVKSFEPSQTRMITNILPKVLEIVMSNADINLHLHEIESFQAESKRQIYFVGETSVISKKKNEINI